MIQKKNNKPAYLLLNFVQEAFPFVSRWIALNLKRLKHEIKMHLCSEMVEKCQKRSRISKQRYSPLTAHGNKPQMFAKIKTRASVKNYSFLCFHWKGTTATCLKHEKPFLLLAPIYIGCIKQNFCEHFYSLKCFVLIPNSAGTYTFIMEKAILQINNVILLQVHISRNIVIITF